MAEGTITRSIILPNTLNEWLLYHAKLRGEPVSTLIRESIRSELARLAAEIRKDEKESFEEKALADLAVVEIRIDRERMERGLAY